MKPFPSNFLFGAALGAHQTDGGDDGSDWFYWEQRPTRIHDGSTSEEGAGHWEAASEDLMLASRLGMNALCLSLSWSRIQPEPEVFDEAVLNHYHKVFTDAARLNLTVVAILYQTALPRWMAERGGWEWEEAPEHFAAYVRKVMERLADECRHWIPLYEAEYLLSRLCHEKHWPGSGRGARRHERLRRNLVAAQCEAARVIRELCPEGVVGVSVRATPVEAWDRHSPWDQAVAEKEQDRLNSRFLKELLSSEKDDNTDFIAMSYYGALRLRFALSRFRESFALPVDEKGRAVDLDDLTPSLAGFEEILLLLSSFKKPIHITGIGVATDDDVERCRFIESHVSTLLHALHSMEPDLNIGGLFYSHFLDGFEWHHGYSRRYGLVHVKRPGMERTPNPSAWLWKEIADHGMLRPGTAEKYCGDTEQ
ncbi:MAG: glycoside hydrolase family 1 protein [Candidatus Hydrogenedens sp.]|jgi:beta-glucosidase|nr:glycoside hydrolase family 1 protein [Candidatus Hydrogenedens sp.]